MRPSRRIGCLPHLTVRKPRSPNRSPPTTSPAAIRIALMDANAVLFSPNLSLSCFFLQNRHANFQVLPCSESNTGGVDSSPEWLVEPSEGHSQTEQQHFRSYKERTGVFQCFQEVGIVLLGPGHRSEEEDDERSWKIGARGDGYERRVIPSHRRETLTSG